MEMDILAYGHELLLPSLTPRRFVGGYLCQAEKKAPLVHSGFAAVAAVGHSSSAGGRAEMTGLQRGENWLPGGQSQVSSMSVLKETLGSYGPDIYTNKR